MEKIYISDWDERNKKKSYVYHDCEAVTDKQQFNTIYEKNTLIFNSGTNRLNNGISITISILKLATVNCVKGGLTLSLSRGHLAEAVRNA